MNKSTRRLTQMAFFVVLQVVLTRFFGITTEINRISFAFVPMALAGAYMGPGYSALTAIAADLIGHFLWPKGPYFVGFTITAALSGALYGVLHKEMSRKERNVWIVLITLIKRVGLHLGLNTYWLHLLGGKSMQALIVGRYFKTFFLIPIDIAVLVLVFKLLAPHLEKERAHHDFTKGH